MVKPKIKPKAKNRHHPLKRHQLRHLQLQLVYLLVFLGIRALLSIQTSLRVYITLNRLSKRGVKFQLYTLAASLAKVSKMEGKRIVLDAETPQHRTGLCQ